MFIQEKTISKRPCPANKNQLSMKDGKNQVRIKPPRKRSALSKLSALILSPRGLRVAFISFVAVAVMSVSAVAAVYVCNVAQLGFSPVKESEHIEYYSYNRVFSEYEPTFNVTIDLGNGNVITSNLPQLTVSEIIDSLDVELDSDDIINLPLDSVVDGDTTISIQDIVYKEVTLTENIPYSTSYVESQTVPKGTKKVVTAGQYGVSTRVLKQKYVNGKLESEQVLSEYISKKPVNKVVATGVGGTFVGGDGKTYNYSYRVDARATAYTGDGKTYTGKNTGPGIVAVDRKTIPLGSKIYVTGKYGDYGVCYAEDIGGGIKGNYIDIWLPTEEECTTFGIRYMTVYVLE